MVELETRQNTALKKITLPQRGIRVFAPEQTARVMAQAQAKVAVGGKFTPEEIRRLWNKDGKEEGENIKVQERARISLMAKCKILARRYPNPKDGKEFMREIDDARREQLLGMAIELTGCIVQRWGEVNPQKGIAVVLFGSVAKGLAKRTENPDPSNIDLAVIGDFTGNEREVLFDKIRQDRLKMGGRIRAACPYIDSPEPNPGNAGVSIQTIETVKRDKFGAVRNYLSSGGIALFDESGIWGRLEQEALNMAMSKNGNGQHKRNG